MGGENVFHIRLNNVAGKIWHIGAEYSIKGFAYYNNQLFEGEALAKIILSAINNHSLDNILRYLNGNYSVIIKGRDCYYLISDKIRSYPLIFTKNIHGEWMVTDNSIGILKSKDIISDINLLSSTEFLALGYVSGNDTLYRNISTVEAGEYVMLYSDGGILRRSYFKYIFEKTLFDKETIINEAYEALESAFKRTINTIPVGSQIVIPLSGGYDSRLIACLCKKFGLENVICYTYGRKDSFEVLISQKVANTLDLPWYYVEYTPEKFAAALKSSQFNKFSEFSSNINSIPHVQEFLALEVLKGKKIIKDGAVVIPGFCGDVFGGSKVPREVFNWSQNKLNSSNFAHLIFEHFYDLNILVKKAKKTVINKIEEDTKNVDLSTEDSFLNNYEQWCISNRLSKYIINSIRVYEFFNLDWRLPLWDDEYAEIWYHVPWRKKSSELLEAFMFDCYFSYYKVNIRKKKLINIGIKKISFFKQCLPVVIRRVIMRSYISLTSNRIIRDYNCFERTAELLFNTYSLKKFPQIKQLKRTNIMAVMSCIEYLKYVRKNLFS